MAALALGIGEPCRRDVAAESRVHEINDLFCDPSYFDRTPHQEVKRLENEQKSLNDKAARLLEEWEEVERALDDLGR